VYAILPGARRELQEASTQGELLGTNSDYRVQIASLARKVAGLLKETPGGPVAQLRSFAGKFRKNNKDVAAAMPS
jgi:hypothetical protein